MILLDQNIYIKKKKNWIMKMKINIVKKVLNGFEIKMLVTKKPIQGKRTKILTPKQILQKLAIALTKIKTDSISKNMQNEMWQTVYSS